VEIEVHPEVARATSGNEGEPIMLKILVLAITVVLVLGVTQAATAYYGDGPGWYAWPGDYGGRYYNGYGWMPRWGYAYPGAPYYRGYGPPYYQGYGPPYYPGYGPPYVYGF
jgi:hypothetical protein